MTIVEAKLNTIIAAYDKLVKGIDDQAAMSRDRAYGGIIRAGKGELVESIATPSCSDSLGGRSPSKPSKNGN